MKMNSIWKAFVLALYFVVFANFATAQTAPAPHWGYSGKTGPKDWGQLEPDFAECSMGHMQSPIDIKGAKKADLPALQFDYNSVPLSIVDNGHTVMVNYAPGSTLKVGDKIYTLKQFHFHHPSEEEINGKRYDLGVHLVHSDADGHLAVVTILFKEGATPSPLLDTLWKNVSAEKEKVVEIASVSINVKNLLPSTTGYYTFTGSLTTPPCSEGVTWYVLNTPVSISKAQLEPFAKKYKHDARPLQPANNRKILESK